MRHALLRLAALLVVLMLALTGCNLITIDPIMQLDEDLAALKKQYSGVVASYDGGTITQEDVMGTFNSQYSYMSQMYSMYGMGMTQSDIESIEQSVVENAVENVAIRQQIEARGLALDPEKVEELNAEVDEHYQDAYDSVYASVTGETEDERVKRTEVNLYSMGYTRDALYGIEEDSANYELIEEAVRAEITENLLDEEKLKQAYEAKLAEDEETYADSPYSFESAMSSDTEVVTWIPEGYRTVKHILVKPDSDALNAVIDARGEVATAERNLEDLRSELDALNDDDAEDTEEAEDAEEAEEEAEAPRTAEEIQVDIDAAEAILEEKKAAAEQAEADCLATVKDTTDAIYQKLADGEEFDALIEEYGEDPGMQNEPTKTRGYYVCSDSAAWDSNFTAGAMLLEKVGDVSETPVISTSGVHIIRYESDVTPGAVPLEDVHDALFNETLEQMRADHFDAELQSWVEALHPTYSIENFNLQ